MKYEPGTRVLIIEDCRDGSPATGQVGVYEGEQLRKAIVRLVDSGKEYLYWPFVNGEIEFSGGTLKGKPLVSVIPFWAPRDYMNHPVGEGFPIVRGSDPPSPFWFFSLNPRIRLADGSVIWGDECWWGDAETAPPLDEAVKDLEEHKTVLLGLMQASAIQREETP